MVIYLFCFISSRWEKTNYLCTFYLCFILYISDPVLEVEEGCSHPTVINDLCAECGADLQKEGVSESNATVPMVHHIPQLKVSQQVILIFRRKFDKIILLRSNDST